ISCPLASPGTWLVRGTELRRARAGGAGWESEWATLTVQGAPRRTLAIQPALLPLTAFGACSSVDARFFTGGVHEEACCRNCRDAVRLGGDRVQPQHRQAESQGRRAGHSGLRIRPLGKRFQPDEKPALRRLFVSCEPLRFLPPSAL